MAPGSVLPSDERRRVLVAAAGGEMETMRVRVSL